MNMKQLRCVTQDIDCEVGEKNVGHHENAVQRQKQLNINQEMFRHPGGHRSGFVQLRPPSLFVLKRQY